MFGCDVYQDRHLYKVKTIEFTVDNTIDTNVIIGIMGGSITQNLKYIETKSIKVKALTTIDETFTYKYIEGYDNLNVYYNKQGYDIILKSFSKIIVDVDGIKFE